MGFGPVGSFDTVGEAGGDELEARLFERLRRGGDLGDDLAALPTFGEHALDCLHRSGGAPLPLADIVDDILRNRHHALLLLLTPCNGWVRPRAV